MATKYTQSSHEKTPAAELRPGPLLVSEFVTQEQDSNSSSIPPDIDEDRREATNEEIKHLPHAPDQIPSAVWVVALLSAAERFTYYAMTTPWQNYMQNVLDSKEVPGALGLGQSGATNVYNGFFFFKCLTPMPFAIISDMWLGRYRTLCLSLAFYVCGAAVMLVTSLPWCLRHGAGLPGLVVTMVFVGLGVGGVKATVQPFIADQYTNVKPRLLKRKDGEYVVADRTLTIQYIFNASYWFTNVAALSSLPSTFLERLVGFWAANLLALLSLIMAFIPFIVWGSRLVKPLPEGNILPFVGKSLLYSIQGGFRLDAATPAYQQEHFQRSVPWNDDFISEMERGLLASRVLSSFIFFSLSYNQMSTNLVSQAGQMQLGGVPNDAIQALNPIACVLLGPVIQNGLYPFLNKRQISFGPIARITAAFIVMGIAMGYAAGIQKLLYSRGPCYSHPLSLTCPGSENGTVPNEVSVWVQTPLFFILAAAEILGFVTTWEYSYSKAPKNMKALLQAFSQLTSAIASAIGMAISPAAKDPGLVWFYAVLAGVSTGFALLFWWMFRKYDRIDEQLNDLNLINEEQQPKDQNV